MQRTDYNYMEPELLDEVLGYITSTYDQHYAGKQDIQLFDYWQSLGLMQPVGIGTAMKYLARFGRKQGANRKDLLKAIHYIILVLWAQDLEDAQQTLADEQDETDERFLQRWEEPFEEERDGDEESEDRERNQDSKPAFDLNDFAKFAAPFEELLDSLSDKRKG